MKMRTWMIRAAIALVFSMSGVGLAANALIVHDGTAGTNADALANLTSKLVAATYTVTPNVGVPGGSLATYKQIWDIRFSNITALSGADITAYVTFMAGGGSLFVMGENTANFLTRDNSIVSLVTSAGGGSITLATPNNNETVQPPFTGPNAISAITFLAAAGSAGYGTGTPVAKDAAGIAAAIVWSPGTLSSASSGSLIAVFDVNFLLTGADATSQSFTRNLIAYLAAPIPLGAASPVPALSTWALTALGLALAAVAVKILAGGVRAA